MIKFDKEKRRLIRRYLIWCYKTTREEFDGYLKNRLEAVEKAIEHFLGKDDLNNIQMLYENEMTNRILQARGHV